jgi:hypothetical protein
MDVLEEQKENLRANVGQLELILQDREEKLQNSPAVGGSLRKPLKGELLLNCLY